MDIHWTLVTPGAAEIDSTDPLLVHQAEMTAHQYDEIYEATYSTFTARFGFNLHDRWQPRWHLALYSFAAADPSTPLLDVFRSSLVVNRTDLLTVEPQFSPDYASTLLRFLAQCFRTPLVLSSNPHHV